MARLVVESGESRRQVIELHWGVNRLGRGPANDFRLDHPAISTNHCEIILGDSGAVVRDRSSTNGTFLDGQRVQEAKLEVGQTLALGNLELLVETTEVTVAIPKIDVKLPSPPAILADGSMLCPRHPRTQAKYRCTHCHAVLCDACLHQLRRRGGKVLLLCPLCSYPCEPIGGTKRGKKNLFALFMETVKIPFGRRNSHTQ